MNPRPFLSALCMAGLLWAGAAQAQAPQGGGAASPGTAPGSAAPPSPPPSPSPAPEAAATEGPEELGSRIARLGLPQQGVAACSSCHGQRGEGQAAAGFPRIAGQSATYLLRQMESYASGSRVHPLMTPIAKALNAEQAAATAGHYARLGFPGAPPLPRPGTARPSPAGQDAATAADSSGQGAARGEPEAGKNAAPDLARGRLLAVRGDERLQLQACANCHGPAGAGQPPVYPYLAGQHATYLNATLEAWRSGQRRNDASGQMPVIAQRLSAGDVAAVAAYYASLPWASSAARVARPGAAMALPAARRSPRGPGGPVAAPSGTGTEQGAPLTGGSQGPGGGGGTRQAPAR